MWTQEQFNASLADYSEADVLDAMLCPAPGDEVRQRIQRLEDRVTRVERHLGMVSPEIGGFIDG